MKLRGNSSIQYLCHRETRGLVEKTNEILVVEFLVFSSLFKYPRKKSTIKDVFQLFRCESYVIKVLDRNK